MYHWLICCRRQASLSFLSGGRWPEPVAGIGRNQTREDVAFFEIIAQAIVALVLALVELLVALVAPAIEILIPGILLLVECVLWLLLILVDLVVALIRRRKPQIPARPVFRRTRDVLAAYADRRREQRNEHEKRNQQK